MDKDFHYYGTYIAARLAGFSTNDAETIAYSAQYVDDSIEYYGRIMKLDENGLEFIPRATCHDAINELGWNLLEPLAPVKVADKDIHRVWMAFHFLPGNYPQTPLPNQVTIDDNDTKINMELLCLPRSHLTANIIKEKSTQASYWLQLLGIKMHAYADTGAHMYYAGLQSTQLNDAHQDVYDITDDNNTKLTWIWGWDWMGYKLGSEICTPPMGTDSIFYLGHGRMGHLPDYPWMKYAYQPEWLSESITKDNPSEFMRTFLEMVLALKYQRTDGGTFDYSSIEEDIMELKKSISEFLPVINDLLITKPDLTGVTSYNEVIETRCDLWKKELSVGGRLANLGLPNDYDPDSWVKEARKPKNKIQDTNYYKFNVAAIEHANFVREELLDEGITQTNWSLLSSKPVGRTVGQISLHNGGGFVVRMQFKYSDDDGNLITSKSTEDILLGAMEQIDPGDYGVPSGSFIRLKVIVEAGNDNIANQELIYEKDNLIKAAYTITGTTMSNTLGLIGFDYA